MQLLQIHEKDSDIFANYETPKFYGLLSDGNTLLVVTKKGNCAFYVVSELQTFKYRTIDVDDEDAYLYNLRRY